MIKLWQKKNNKNSTLKTKKTKNNIKNFKNYTEKKKVYQSKKKVEGRIKLVV